MKLLFCLLLASNLSTLAVAGSSRSVFLNGIDISSAKNQALNQVNIRIDSYGNIYVEAPQYDVQKETHFLPMGKQIRGQTPGLEHKLPKALNHSPDSVTAPTKDQKIGVGSPLDQGNALTEPASLPNDEVKVKAPPSIKEGTRSPSNGNQERQNSSPEASTNPG